MKGRVVVLGQWNGDEAAALMVDGQLEDLALDPDAAAPGAIFRATVDRMVKGQGGVFLKLPDGLRGFLRETGGLAPGASVIAQVSGHAEPGKALPMTLRPLFKGRWLIVTPGAAGVNVSRQIRDADTRAALTALVAPLLADSSTGVILRSAADTAAPETIEEEAAQLLPLARAVMADIAGPPELLLAAPSPHELALRDWLDPAPDAVEEGADAFAAQGVAEALDQLRLPALALPGGGSLVIEPTRALVAVDVNTGPDTSLAAGLKANIATARALPRALRLRGLGGQVVIDFAPMPKKDRAALEQQLRAAFKADGTETSLAGWTPLGLYELQRKRDRRPTRDFLGAAR